MGDEEGEEGEEGDVVEEGLRERAGEEWAGWRWIKERNSWRSSVQRISCTETIF